MITSQQPNVNKEESIVFVSTESIKKANPKENFVFTQETKGLNLTKHLAVSYRQNSKDSGRSIYDVYVSGNDSLGKLQAKFLNSHPKLLVKFLNRDYGFNITPKQLR